jgi:hypothetical protein
VRRAELDGRRRRGVFLPDCLADGEVDSQHQAAADAGGAAEEVAAGDAEHSNVTRASEAGSGVKRTL